MSDQEAKQRAMAVIESLLDRYAAGRLQRPQDQVGAASALAQSLAVVSQGQVDRPTLIKVAQANQILGEMNLKSGRLDDAVDAFDEAMRLFELDDEDSEEYGRFLHDYSIVLQGLNVPGFPLKLAERSKEILGRHGTRHIRDLDAWIAKLRHGADSDDNVEALRVATAKARRGVPRARAAQQLGVALSQRDDAERYADEIFDSLRYAFGKLAKRGSAEDASAALSPVLNLYWIGVTLPDWVGDAAQVLAGKAERETRFDVLRDALTVCAGWLAQRGSNVEAIEVALRAVARHDEYMLATETSMFRMLTSYSGQFAREIAVRVALRLDDIPLAAELLETARLQVLPDRGERSADKPGRSRLRGLRAVSVDGRSRLAQYYTPALVEGQVALETTIAAVGGHAAIWWSTWWVGSEIYWTVRLDGRWHGGVIDAAPTTGAGRTLRRAREISMVNPTASTRDVITGEWCRSAAAEEMLSAELGDILIPEVLRESLLNGREAPRSLVVAGNVVTRLPLPLLGMRRDFLDTPTRLIEVAVPRVAPPAVYVEVVLSRPSAPAQVHPIRVACVDPTGNLRNSGTPPADSALTLSGSPNSEWPRATLANLTDALSYVAAGEPGIFYYSGHVAAAGFGGDDEDGLPLSDGEGLSARMMFEADSDSYAFPARSMLCACQSGGTGGAGAGEWLGLGAAFLWRGSRQVVATNWKIWDLPFTQSFDHDIADRLRSAEDPAGALRDAQLAALLRWRVSQHDFADHTAEGSLPSSARNLALPLVWGAYCCLGVRQ